MTAANMTVYAIHTGPVLVEVIRAQFARALPGVRLVNVVDDGLLAEVRAAGAVTPTVARRVLQYGIIAQSSGADAILNCCSSVGEVADLLAQTLDIPVVKIDDRMATRAVELGPRIAIVGTVATTLAPTERMIQRKADAAASAVNLRRYLIDDAFDALLRGEAEAHDKLVQAAIVEAMRDNDVVVLAQGSMARLVPLFGDKPAVPILSSPVLGVEALAERLGLR